MGLLALGTPLQWDEAKNYANHVRNHGITQFLRTWDKFKDRRGDILLWGDEVEYIVVSMDEETRNAKLSLRQSEILAKLQNITENLCTAAPDSACDVPQFHAEYGRYMLESTPGSPYNDSLLSLLSVERNMRYRRMLARKHLKPTEFPVTLTSFPRLGVPGVFTEPFHDPSNAQASHSLFLPDEITNPHVRFPTLTANIRRRRGSKVAINLPIFFDVNTPRPFIDPTIPWDRKVFPEDPEAANGAALQDHIYMDAMGFGMGCCCLQITFQACNVDEARRVYDALVPVGPIMLALTAASPVWRGFLSDVDCRWNVISASVDDRTEEERGLKPLSESKFRIPKSRYGSVDSYISNDIRNKPEYNDIPAPFDEELHKRLRDHGIDDLLAKHISHLFIRDPLVIFSETIDQDDNNSIDHFENIQSTNWQTLRFKPPPRNAPIGWRVEFRTMEVQMTDFENAAFSIFIVLLSRAILKFGLNFYIPISKVDENMQRAQKRGAAQHRSFFFRKSIYPPGNRMGHSVDELVLPTPPSEGEVMLPASMLRDGLASKDVRMPGCYTHPAFVEPDYQETNASIDDEYEEMTLDEIINGKGTHFPGLLGVVNAYVHSLNVEYSVKHRIRRYLNLIKRRADGSLATPATWIRNFVRSHPDYKFDSFVSQEINFDLIKAVIEIEQGTRAAPDLLPEDYQGSAAGNP